MTLKFLASDCLSSRYFDSAALPGLGALVPAQVISRPQKIATAPIVAHVINFLSQAETAQPPLSVCHGFSTVGEKGLVEDSKKLLLLLRTAESFQDSVPRGNTRK